MNKTRNKLTSRAGASLGISLLLFLVCAVLGSVILTAGTTTMSRVSAVSGSDQRYYSVTSAAELMKKELVGKTVTIEKTRYQYDNGNPTDYIIRIKTVKEEDKKETEDIVLSTNVTIAEVTKPDFTNDNKFLYENMSYLTGCATRLMFGSEAINTETAMNATFAQGRYLKKSDSNEYVEDSKNKRAETQIILDHGIPGLDVEAIGTLLEDGTLIIKLTNIEDFEAGEPVKEDPNPYTLTMTLTPVFEETSSVSKTTDYSTGDTTETKVNTSIVHWEIGGISKRFTAES